MRIWTLPIILIMLALAGCEKTEMLITLNPDGTGKIDYQTTQPLEPMFSLSSRQTRKPADRAQDIAESLLQNSAGIDAWQNLSYTFDDETVTFSGTAYFRDLNAVRFQAHANVTTQTADLRVESLPNGLRVLLAKDNEASSDQPAGRTYSEEELPGAIKKHKSQVERQLIAIEPILNDMQRSYTLKLPGTIDSAVNFTKQDSTTATIVMEGEAMLKAIREMIQDDAWWRKQLTSGRRLQDLDSETLNKHLYGQAAPPQLVVSGPMKPQFDYVQEVKTAQAGFEAELEKLGLSKDVLPPAQGEDFTRLEVWGASWLRQVDNEQNIRPLTANEGYQLGVIGYLAGQILALDKLTLTTAMDDTGKSLLPKHAFHQLNLSKNRDVAVMTINLASPSAEATGIDTLEGTLSYTVASGTERHDFGLIVLQAAELDGPAELSITEIADSKWKEGSQEITFKLDMAPTRFKELKLFDQDGLVLNLESGSSWSSGDQLQKTYRYPGKLPARARLELVLHAETKRYTIPLKLSNLDLMGRPR